MLKDSALETRVWRKLDLRVLPLAAIFYLLSFLVSRSFHYPLSGQVEAKEINLFLFSFFLSCRIVLILEMLVSQGCNRI